jgi:hypothetical protein
MSFEQRYIAADRYTGGAAKGSVGGHVDDAISPTGS